MLRRALLLLAVVVVALAGAASSLLASGTAQPAKSTTALTSTVALSSTTSTALTSTTAPATTTTPTTSATSTAATTTTTVAAPPAALTTSIAASAVVFTGHGWGHGVGMGQWGAYGYALHGWTYPQILAHYYPGTTLGRAPGATVRVLLAAGRKRLTLASTSTWQVVDGAGNAVALPAGKLTLTRALTVNGQQLVSPLLFKPGPSPLEVGTTPYRGRLRVILLGTTLQLVNVVGLEQYLQGVVPAESPSTWPAQALDAQAVAARSYALAELTTVVTASNFDLYSDTRSQVYGGIADETPTGNEAVGATLHQVVLYQGQIATTYFSSSSGGRTTSAAEAFGTPVPYLVSVPDPYDTYSPYHDWGPVLFDARAVAKAVGLPGQQLVDLQMTPDPSGHVANVTAVGSRSQVALTGSALSADLGLRSSWFSVGWLALDPPAAPVTYGGAVTLSGVARNLGPVTLEAKPAGGDWQPLGSVVPDASGAFSMSVNPQVTTQYRLTAGTLHAGLAKATVVPAVQATVGTNTVAGTVRPALADSAVQLQLKDGIGWTTVATGTTDSAGSFTVPAQLAAGSYRVRIAPGRGLSPGVSPALDVP